MKSQPVTVAFGCMIILFTVDTVTCKNGSGRGGSGGFRPVGRSGIGRGTAVGVGAGVAGVVGTAALVNKYKRDKSMDNRSKSDELTGAYLIPAGGGNYYPVYKTQEVTSYYKREGTGISAWGIVALILGVIGSCTVAWFCYMVGLPIWRDRRRRHSLISSSDPIQRHNEGMPLQETPSTATPSP